MPSQYWLTSTFLRFQESYESPNPDFRGRWFTLEDFQDWYQTTRGGKFTYYTDLVGSNFPDTVLRRAASHDLTRKESWVLSHLNLSDDKFYCIATNEADSDGNSTIAHEVVHGLFYLDSEYRNRVEELVESFDFTSFKAALSKQGYTDEVLVDEINSYVLTGLTKNLWLKNPMSYIGIKPRLRRLFIRHFEHDITIPAQAAAFIQKTVKRIDGKEVVNWRQISGSVNAHENS